MDGLILGQASIDTVESFDLSLAREAGKKFLQEIRNGLILGLIGGQASIDPVGELIGGLIPCALIGARKKFLQEIRFSG